MTDRQYITLIEQTAQWLSVIGSVRSTDPTWRHWDKISEDVRGKLAKLKSSHIDSVRRKVCE